MKSFSQLTTEQQSQAISKCLHQELMFIMEVEYPAWVEVYTKEVADKIKAAIEKAADLSTPWFAPEYIIDACRSELTDAAVATAEVALYAEPADPPVIYGIADKESKDDADKSPT